MLIIFNEKMHATNIYIYHLKTKEKRCVMLGIRIYYLYLIKPLVKKSLKMCLSHIYKDSRDLKEVLKRQEFKDYYLKLVFFKDIL